MQYTLRNVPRHVDRALRELADKTGKSLNEAALEALARGVGASDDDTSRRDLSDIAGTWQRDRKLEQALDDQRRVDDELWR